MFPKAKIHRFNDNTSCAPPPGTYDPKVDAHVPNVVIPSSKRFTDQLFSSSSLENLKKETSEFRDVVFRTPQPRKKITTPASLVRLAKNLDTPLSSSSASSSKSEENLYLSSGPKVITRLDYNRLEQQYSVLSDKFKSVTFGLSLEVSKLKDELLEIKTNEAKLKVILQEKNDQESERSKEVLELKESLDVFEQKLIEERLCHKKYIYDLETEIEELKEKRYELEGIISAKESAIVNFNEKFNGLEDEIIKLKEELENKNEVLLQVKETHTEILDSVVSHSEEKLKIFEERLFLNIQEMEREFDTKSIKMQDDFQTKLNFVSHDFDVKKECMEKEMNLCLSRITELEDFVDKTTKCITKDINEANERCKFLFEELCKVEAERDDLLVSDLEKKMSIIETQEKCDSSAEDCDLFREKCKKYEITLSSMRTTVKVLSSRLVESENEVERLSLVEVDLDTQKKLLEEKSQLLLADITTLREGMARLEKDIVNDVAAQREHLLAKVEGYKAEVSRQVGFLNNQINEKQHAISILLQENDYYKNESGRKDSQVKELCYKVKQYKDDIVQLKISFSKLEDDFNEKLGAQKNLYKILNDKLLKSNNIIDELTSLKINHDVTIASLLKKNEIFQKEVSRFVRDLNDLKTKNTAQTNEIAFLQTKIQLDQTKIGKYEEAKEKQQQYIDGLVSDLVLEKERCVALENEKDIIKDHLDLAEMDISNITDEKENIEMKLTKVKADLKRAESNLTENMDAQVELERKLLDYQNKESQYTSNIQKEKELEAKITDLQASLSSAKEQIKAEIPKLEHDNIDKAEHILELSLTIDSLKEEIDEGRMKVTALVAEKSDLTLQLDESNCKIANLKDEIDKAQYKIACLESEKASLLHQFGESNYGVSNLKEEFEEILTKVTCLEAEKVSLSLQLEETNCAMTNLKNEMTITENNKNMVLNQLRNQINVSRERDEENNRMIESLQVSIKKQTELLQSNANCQIELTNAQAKISELETLIKIKNKDLQLHQKQYTENTNDLQSRLEKAERESHHNFSQLEQERATLKKENEELKSKLRTVIDERDKLDKELTDMVGHHNNLQRIRHVYSLKQHNIDLKEEIEKLSQENIKLKSQLQEFKENSHTSRIDTPRPPLKAKSAKKLASPGVLKERNH